MNTVIFTIWISWVYFKPVGNTGQYIAPCGAILLIIVHPVETLKWLLSSHWVKVDLVNF